MTLYDETNDAKSTQLWQSFFGWWVARSIRTNDFKAIRKFVKEEAGDQRNSLNSESWAKLKQFRQICVHIEPAAIGLFPHVSLVIQVYSSNQNNHDSDHEKEDDEQDSNDNEDDDDDETTYAYDIDNPGKLLFQRIVVRTMQMHLIPLLFPFPFKNWNPTSVKCAASDMVNSGFWSCIWKFTTVSTGESVCPLSARNRKWFKRTIDFNRWKAIQVRHVQRNVLAEQWIGQAQADSQRQRLVRMENRQNVAKMIANFIGEISIFRCVSSASNTGGTAIESTKTKTTSEAIWWTFRGEGRGNEVVARNFRSFKLPLPVYRWF